MSDERLRELERVWRQTGAVDDEVAFLRERVRAGTLDEQRVRLAAWLGRPAAEQIAGAAATFVAPRGGASGSDTFWRGLLTHGEEAAQRAILAEARRATRRVVELAHDAAKPGRSVARVRAIVDGTPSDPVEHEAAAWWRAVQQIVESATACVLAPGDEARAVLARDLERVERVPMPVFPARPPRVGAALSDLARAIDQLHVTVARIDRSPWRALPAEHLVALRATICAEVAPWALGTRDVLREELQGRVDRIQIASPCTAAWDAMTPIGADGRTRHCATCNLAVHDLAAYTAAEVDELLRQRAGRRLCVNLYRRTDGRVITQDCPTGLSRRTGQRAEGVEMRGGLG